jgi:hypothetical protein
MLIYIMQNFNKLAIFNILLKSIEFIFKFRNTTIFDNVIQISNINTSKIIIYSI